MTILLIAWLAAQTPDALAECKRHQSEFAIDDMERACRAVSDDPSRDVASRIYALRLLAGAQLLKSDERAAEMVLVRMLTFDIDAAPAPDDGPEFRRLLANARQRVIDEGVLEVTLVREGDVVRSVQLRDPLGRVARVEAQGARGGKQLARFDEKPGLATFVVPVDVVDGDVVLVGWTNKELRRIALTHAAAPASTRRDAEPSEAVDNAAPARAPMPAALPWTMIVGGSAIAAAGALLTLGTFVDGNAAEPCAASPEGCVPNRSLLFGLYSPDQRADFFDDYQGWLAAGAFTTLLGGALAAGGVVLLVTE